MFIFSLDEGGTFERLGNSEKPQPAYIGGLLFNGGQNEIKQEERRIEAYYKKAIRDAGYSDECYPEALHIDNGTDRKMVKAVKQKISASLPEFLKSGTYQGKPLLTAGGIGNEFGERRGKYYPCAILKSEEGLQALLTDKTNILSKDDYASNLYFHMASSLISHVVFENPILDVDEIDFLIATRTTPDIENRSDTEEYESLGYNARGRSGNVHYKLTNEDVYRSMLAEKITYNARTEIKVDSFRVESIRYKHMSQRTKKSQEFLFLADSICSFLKWNAQGTNTGRWLDYFSKRLEQLSGRDINLLFGYDDIDVVFQQACRFYEYGAYYEALSLMSDGTQGPFGNYYKTVWFPLLRRKIIDSGNTAAFSSGVAKIRDSLFSNSFEQEKGIYILKTFIEMAKSIEPKFRTDESKKAMYQLYDAAVSVYCHIGDSNSAEEYFRLCRNYADKVGLEEYLQTMNKVVVIHCDRFEYQQAFELADQMVTYQELLSEMKSEVDIPGDSGGTAAYGKALSQRGQIYAYLRDSHAEDDFRKALAVFQKGSANYKITQSYLLHHYIDLGDKEKYLEEAADYFGGKREIADQVDYILSEGRKLDPYINLKYAFFVLVKAAYVFKTGLSNASWDAIVRLEKDLNKDKELAKWKLIGHPAELIYKYMQLLQIEKVKEDRKKEGKETRPRFKYDMTYKKSLDECLSSVGDAERAICLYADIQIAEAAGQSDVDIRELYGFIGERFGSDGFDQEASAEEMNRHIRALMTYMYC